MLDYAWLMLLFPALGTLIIALLGTRLGKRIIGILAPGMVLLTSPCCSTSFRSRWR